MSVDSVLPVVDSYMPLVLSVTADPEDEAHDVKVTHISIQIHADANDSLIYTEDRQPGTATAEVNEALDLGNVTTAIPATIRVTATNACGLMSTQERPLLIKPE